MEREIKYRGKLLSIGDWKYGSLLHSENIGDAIAFEIGHGEVKRTDWIFVDKETIGEFTTHKDKNGIEIYEGDIIKTLLGNVGFIKFGTHEDIVYSKEASCAGYKEDSFECTGWLFENIKTKEVVFMDSSIINGEIIGNIYDNPELLKKRIVI